MFQFLPSQEAMLLRGSKKGTSLPRNFEPLAGAAVGGLSACILSGGGSSLGRGGCGSLSRGSLRRGLGWRLEDGRREGWDRLRRCGGGSLRRRFVAPLPRPRKQGERGGDVSCLGHVFGAQYTLLIRLQQKNKSLAPLDVDVANTVVAKRGQLARRRLRRQQSSGPSSVTIRES